MGLPRRTCYSADMQWLHGVAIGKLNRLKSKTLHMKCRFDHKYALVCCEHRIIIMLTCLCNVDPLTLHFYIVKLGFTLVSFFVLKHRLLVLVKNASMRWL